MPTSTLAHPQQHQHSPSRFLSMYLLDTHVVSEIRKMKSGKADAKVKAWISSVNAGTLYISVITILELEQGILG